MQAFAYAESGLAIPMRCGRTGHKSSVLLVCLLVGTTALLSGCSGVVAVVSPSAVTVTTGGTVQFAALVSGMPIRNAMWEVNGVVGGSRAVGTITDDGLYTAPSSPGGIPFLVAVANPASAPASVSIFNPQDFAPGTVSATNNPLVAAYSFAAPVGSLVEVAFGTDQNYGLTTSFQSPVPGANTTVLVAGMRASTTYHMKAILEFTDGTTLSDTDHVFTTGALEASLIPSLGAAQFGSTPPGPGIELLCLDPIYGGNALTAVATDLAGNVIWYYDIGPGEWPYPMKLMPNGHMLVNVSAVTNSQGQIPPGSVNEIREIDLAGNVVYRITVAQLNQALANLGMQIGIESLHHDILILPDGDLIILFNFQESPDGVATLGDGLIEWNPTLNTGVWAWSSFDHLSVSRNPSGTPDWTHANAVIYSPDDHNVIVSLRNQNWIIKINYQNGKGDGSILWHLGPDGDFGLPAGYAASEWNYGQHYPTLTGTNSAGTFPLMFFNNGNDRPVGPNGDEPCNYPEGPVYPGNPECYSSVPIFQLNENSNTMQVVSEDKLEAFSECCGNATILPNGNLEYDVALDAFTPGASYVQEAIPENDYQIIWQLIMEKELAYRAFRVPSLYPGVTWSLPGPAVSAGAPLPNASATRASQPLKMIGRLP